jgi:type II secretory pathway component PulK
MPNRSHRLCCAHRPFHRRSRERGSSLLLVLWAVMLMSLAVLGLVDHLSRGLDESVAAEKDFRARLLLQSARTVAEHPAIERGDPLLRRQVTSATSFEVTLTTEGTRLAVNQIGESRAQRDFAQRLFEHWGLSSAGARTLSDSIADWVDANDRPRRQGAERDHYASLGRHDFPFNRPFDTLNDVLLVRGAEEMDRRQPAWRDFMTLHGDGTIDLHLAPSPILESLFDVTPSEIGRFLRARLGPDGIADTKDDPRYTTLPQVRALLDVPELNWRAVDDLLTLNHPIRRTVCLARVGRHERRLTLITGGGLNLVTEE